MVLLTSWRGAGWRYFEPGGRTVRIRVPHSRDFSVGQRLDNDCSVRCCQSAEVIRIGGLHDSATCFNRDGDGMGIREQRGTGTGLSEQRSSLAGRVPGDGAYLSRPGYSGWLPVIPAGARHPDGRASAAVDRHWRSHHDYDDCDLAGGDP